MTDSVETIAAACMTLSLFLYFNKKFHKGVELQKLVWSRLDDRSSNLDIDLCIVYVSGIIN